MALNISAVAGEVRSLIGAPSTAEYSEDNVTRAINRAIEKYSKHVPYPKQISVPLEAGKSYYQLDDNVYVILAHSLNNNPFGSFNVEDPLTYKGTMYGPLMYTVAPSVSGALMDKFLFDYQMDRVREDSDSIVSMQGNLLEVLPTPTEAGTLYLLIGMLHTCNTFPVLHSDILKKCAAAICAVELANLRSKFPSIKVGSENVTFRDPSYLLNQAKDWEKEFNDYFGNLRLVLTQ